MPQKAEIKARHFQFLAPLLSGGSKFLKSQQDAVYPTVVAIYENEHWLVMFSLDGIMETAFPPTDPVTYLSDPRFRYIGTMQELLP